jgi:hypothetical protein
MNEVMKIIKQFDCTVIRQETNLFCLVETGIPKNRLEEVLYKFKDLREISADKIT